jgi:hypothetical protein
MNTIATPRSRSRRTVAKRLSTSLGESAAALLPLLQNDYARAAIVPENDPMHGKRAYFTVGRLTRELWKQSQIGIYYSVPVDPKIGHRYTVGRPLLRVVTVGAHQERAALDLHHTVDHTVPHHGINRNSCAIHQDRMAVRS